MADENTTEITETTEPTLEERVAALETSVAQLSVNLGEISTNLSTLAESINSINTLITAAESRITALEGVGEFELDFDGTQINTAIKNAVGIPQVTWTNFEGKEIISGRAEITIGEKIFKKSVTVYAPVAPSQEDSKNRQVFFSVRNSESMNGFPLHSPHVRGNVYDNGGVLGITLTARDEDGPLVYIPEGTYYVDYLIVQR